MSRSVTIELSDEIYSQLQRVAELSQVPIDSVIEQSLTYSLLPLLDEIPLDYQADLLPLLQMSVVELQAEARQRFPTDQWREYERLLSKNKQATLTAQEHTRLDTLRQAADVLSLRKAYAAVLLKRLGHAVPNLQALEQTS